MESVQPTEHFYVGLTDDLASRLGRHNAGGVPHTAKFLPWRIKTAIAFRDRAKAAELHIWGSSELLQTLIAAEQVDEFRVWVYPLVLGKGKRLFENGAPPRGLTLVESRRGPKDVLLNTYRPTGLLPPRSLDPDNPSEAELARRRKLAAEQAQG